MMNTKLLLIEDDEDDYLLTRELLDEIAAGQYTLCWAPSATEGRRALARNEHDVCLMDYRLGADDGLTLLEQAPALGFSGPIIMLTAQDNSEVDIGALNAGAVDYLVKSHLNGARLARSIRYAVARREVEAERLERLRAEAESRSKSEFLAHLSHELRTPLTAILGYADILLQRNRNERDEADLQTIKRNGQHLLSLLNDVLDLSKISAGKLEITVQSVDLNRFLAELRSLMEVAAKQKNLTLQFTADQPLPDVVETDPIRLRQILINLIGNAIKFTERGQVQVDVAAHAVSSQLGFAVSDTGVGIARKEIRRLFQPFAQADGKKLTREQGSGLGLAISKQLAGRLGGDIEVTSEPGRGSTFTLLVDSGDLDRATFAPLAMSAKPRLEPHHNQIRISGKVLVVDDLPDIRRLIGEIIANAGARVEYASDGEESIGCYVGACDKGDPFDLIVMDMQMPTTDGLTASKKLRRRGCRCPILALTAATMQGEKERCITAGCDDYLSKPVDESSLLKSVQALLSTQRDTGNPSRDPSTAEKYILLVEDNADARHATREILLLLGWRVIEADCAAEAHRIVAQHAPYLALVDLSLPDLNGYRLIEELRGDGLSSTHFITLSGHEADADRQTATGVSLHLVKPLGLTELKEALATVA